MEPEKSTFVEEITEDARKYEEAADEAEVKINSWDTFFQEKQVEILEVQSRMGSFEVATIKKVVNPQASIAGFYEAQRADLKSASMKIKESKEEIREKVKALFFKGT